MSERQGHDERDILLQSQHHWANNHGLLGIVRMPVMPPGQKPFLCYDVAWWQNRHAFNPQQPMQTIVPSQNLSELFWVPHQAERLQLVHNDISPKHL